MPPKMILSKRYLLLWENQDTGDPYGSIAMYDNITDALDRAKEVDKPLDMKWEPCIVDLETAKRVDLGTPAPKVGKVYQYPASPKNPVGTPMWDDYDYGKPYGKYGGYGSVPTPKKVEDISEDLLSMADPEGDTEEAETFGPITVEEDKEPGGD